MFIGNLPMDEDVLIPVLEAIGLLREVGLLDPFVLCCIPCLPRSLICTWQLNL